jgi:hypothetical protein
VDAAPRGPGSKGRMRRGEVVIEQTTGRETEKGGGGAALATVGIGFSGACSGLGF